MDQPLEVYSLDFDK